MIIEHVPASLVPTLWPHISPFLEKAVRLTPELMSMDDVYNGAVAGDYIFWLAIDKSTKEIAAVFTSRIVQNHRSKTLIVDFIGGKKMKSWAGMAVEAMREQAKRNDCQTIEGYGRRAWWRWVRQYGGKQAYVAYQMEL